MLFLRKKTNLINKFRSYLSHFDKKSVAISYSKRLTHQYNAKDPYGVINGKVFVVCSHNDIDLLFFSKTPNTSFVENNINLEDLDDIVINELIQNHCIVDKPYVKQFLEKKLKHHLLQRFLIVINIATKYKYNVSDLDNYFKIVLEN